MCVPTFGPGQLCFDGFEEIEEDQKTVWGPVFLMQDHGIVVAIAFAAHGYLEAVLRNTFLIVVRTVLRPAIGIMNTTVGQLPQRRDLVRH
jgi:hypothetical protein